jgi:hypothetical protein
MFRPVNFFQAAFIVKDLRRAIEAWRKSSPIGPFFVLENVCPENGIYRGRPTDLVMSLAIAQAGAVQIELIEQHSPAASVYRDAYPAGQEGFHHLACFTESLTKEATRYADAGVDNVYQATSGSLNFAYFDTRSQLGCMTEVLEYDGPTIAMFESFRDAAINWDGSDPVRIISSAGH